MQASPTAQTEAQDFAFCRAMVAPSAPVHHDEDPEEAVETQVLAVFAVFADENAPSREEDPPSDA